jgi:hypothetical protein
MRDGRWHRTAIRPSLACGDVTLTNFVQGTIAIEDLQVVCSSSHVLVEPCETSDGAPAIRSLGQADSPQQLLNKSCKPIRKGWGARASMVGLTQCRVVLIRSIWDTNRIRRIHGTIQHANLIDDGSHQMRVLLHDLHSFVQLVLESVIARLAAGEAVVSVEVPTNVRRATTRNI